MRLFRSFRIKIVLILLFQNCAFAEPSVEVHDFELDSVVFYGGWTLRNGVSGKLYQKEHPLFDVALNRLQDVLTSERNRFLINNLRRLKELEDLHARVQTSVPSALTGSNRKKLGRNFDRLIDPYRLIEKQCREVTLIEIEELIIWDSPESKNGEAGDFLDLFDADVGQKFTYVWKPLTYGGFKALKEGVSSHLFLSKNGNHVFGGLGLHPFNFFRIKRLKLHPIPHLKCNLYLSESSPENVDRLIVQFRQGIRNLHSYNEYLLIGPEVYLEDLRLAILNDLVGYTAAMRGGRFLDNFNWIERGVTFSIAKKIMLDAGFRASEDVSFYRVFESKPFFDSKQSITHESLLRSLGKIDGVPYDDYWSVRTLSELFLKFDIDTEELAEMAVEASEIKSKSKKGFDVCFVEIFNEKTKSDFYQEVRGIINGFKMRFGRE